MRKINSLPFLHTLSSFRIESIALPAIGAGIGGVSPSRCAQIMLRKVKEYLEKEETSIEKVYFVLFGDEVFQAFQSCYERMK